jgi:hypothetical protein
LSLREHYVPRDQALAEPDTGQGPSGAAQESNLPSRGLHDRTGFEGLCPPIMPVPDAAIAGAFGHVRSRQVGTKTGTKLAETTIP